MKNIISTRMPGILASARAVLPAVTKYAAPLGLAHSTPTKLTTNFARLRSAIVAAQNAKEILEREQKALNFLFKKGRKHSGTARDSLRFHFGPNPSLHWTGAGYEGSLAMPRAIMPVVNRLQKLAAYLADHPEHENGPMNVTAEETRILAAELIAARVAVNRQAAEVKRLIKDRDAKAEVVRKDLRTLLAELKVLIDPMHPVWEEFGFKRPGAQHIPEVPENVSVELIGPTDAVMKLERPARAKRYHVWQKIVGVDADFVRVATRRDIFIALNNLPPDAELEFALSALNNGGESLRSNVVVVRTGSLQT